MADTRKDKRTPVALKVRFRSATVDEFIEQYSTDLSRGGIFVKSARPMKVGTLLKFQFQLKDESNLIRGVGRVVWTREDDSDPEAPPGMGIKFIKMDDQSKTNLDRVLSASAKDKASRYEDGPGGTGGEMEPAGAHPSDPPEESFFPTNTVAEEDLPPPEDRTAVRHASEFLAGALSGVEDAEATAEAEASAERARERDEEIAKEREAEAKRKSEPSIVVDSSLEEEPKTEVGASAGGTQQAAPAAADDDAAEDTEVDSEAAHAAAAVAAAETPAAETSAAETPAAETPASTKAEPQAEVPTMVVPAEKESSGGGMGWLWLVLLLVAGGVVYALSTRGSGEPASSASLAPAPEPVPEVTEPAASAAEAPDEDEALAADASADAAADGAADATEAAEATDPLPANAPMVTQRVVTVPGGAQVYVNGELKGEAPLNLELPEGVAVEVSAKLPGREQVTREVTADDQTHKAMRLVLARLPYVVSVTSEPPGALAIASGQRAETPGELDLGIPGSGRVVVLVRKKGFVQARRVLLVGEFEERDGAMRQSVEVELTESPMAKAARAKPQPSTPAPSEATSPEANAPAPEPTPEAQAPEAPAPAPEAPAPVPEAPAIPEAPAQP